MLKDYQICQLTKAIVKHTMMPTQCHCGGNANYMLEIDKKDRAKEKIY